MEANPIPYYDHNFKRYQERTARRLDLEALKQFCSRMPEGALILDAGCGPGRDLRFFNQMGFRAEGVDLSQQMVDAARAHSGCKTWQADVRLLTLPRESYDGIWAHQVFIHFTASACQRVLAAFFTAIKPGGHLFVSIREGAGEAEDRTDDPQGPSRIIHRYGADDFASLIRQSGFQVLQEGRTVGEADRVAFIARRL